MVVGEIQLEFKASYFETTEYLVHQVGSSSCSILYLSTKTGVCKLVENSLPVKSCVRALLKKLRNRRDEMRKEYVENPTRWSGSIFESSIKRSIKHSKLLYSQNIKGQSNASNND